MKGKMPSIAPKKMASAPMKKKAEKHSDVEMDKKLIKKMVKKSCHK